MFIMHFENSFKYMQRAYNKLVFLHFRATVLFCKNNFISNELCHNRKDYGQREKEKELVLPKS